MKKVLVILMVLILSAGVLSAQSRIGNSGGGGLGPDGNGEWGSVRP